jgi:hypothetical protein
MPNKEMERLMLIGFRKMIKDAENYQARLIKEYRENAVADEAKRRQIDQARGRVTDLRARHREYINNYIAELETKKEKTNFKQK